MTNLSPPTNAPNPLDNTLTPIAQNRDVIPVELAELTRGDAGQGVSFDRDDILTPLARILQTNSPQCSPRDAAYIAGAEPGHWWLRNALHPIISGVDGISAIHCGQRHVWIEYAPQRGGFVAKHDVEPTDLVDGLNDKGRPISIRSSTKNVVEHVREIYLLTLLDSVWLPYVFGCSKTQHQFAKEFMTHICQHRHPTSGAVMPSFARTYKLTTIPTKNALGSWFKPKFEDLGWTPKAEYLEAKKFHQFVQQGTARGDYHGEYADAT
jgi:hypothetical protein